MAAAVEGAWTPSVDRDAAIKEGLALVDQGLSYKAAGERVRIPSSTLWVAAKKAEAELAELQADAEAHQRIIAKARMACEMAVDRIVRDLPTCHERYVAPWAWTAARLAGVAEGNTAESGVSDGVAKLLTALGTRASVTAAIRVEAGPNHPNPAPSVLDVTPSGEKA